MFISTCLLISSSIGSRANEEKQHGQRRRNAEKTCSRKKTSPQDTEEWGQDSGSDVQTESEIEHSRFTRGRQGQDEAGETLVNSGGGCVDPVCVVWSDSKCFVVYTSFLKQ